MEYKDERAYEEFLAEPPISQVETGRDQKHTALLYSDRDTEMV